MAHELVLLTLLARQWSEYNLDMYPERKRYLAVINGKGKHKLNKKSPHWFCPTASFLGAWIEFTTGTHHNKLSPSFSLPKITIIINTSQTASESVTF